MEVAASPSQPEQVEDKPANQATEPAPARQPLATAEASATAVNQQLSTNSVSPPSGSNNDTNAVISPQMLLRFFPPPGSGNAREAVIVTPPGFNPPQPAPPREIVPLDPLLDPNGFISRGKPASSSATYTSSKK